MTHAQIERVKQNGAANKLATPFFNYELPLMREITVVRWTT